MIFFTLDIHYIYNFLIIKFQERRNIVICQCKMKAVHFYIMYDTKAETRRKDSARLKKKRDFRICLGAIENDENAN